jgi:lipocalin
MAVVRKTVHGNNWELKIENGEWRMMAAIVSAHARPIRDLPYLPEMKLLPNISPKQTKLLIACCISLFIAMFFFQNSNAQELQTVPEVDLQRYAGKWFEIASYPQSFQRGCTCTTATYTLSEEGFVVVENQCNKGATDGPVSYIKGKAFVQEDSGNAKLKVQFFWPLRGKYWIIDLASERTVQLPNP